MRLGVIENRTIIPISSGVASCSFLKLTFYIIHFMRIPYRQFQAHRFQHVLQQKNVFPWYHPIQIHFSMPIHHVSTCHIPIIPRV